MARTRQPIVAKGETPSGIARKWKHRDWKPIWNAPENAKLKKKRGKPGN